MMLTRQLLRAGRPHIHPFLRPTCQPTARLFTTSPIYNSKKPHAPPKPVDPLKPPVRNILAEADVSAKEQRKADWGIIKEMSHYLWPKVCALTG